MAYPFPQDQIPANLEQWQCIPVTPHKPCDLHPTQYVIRIDRILALAEGGLPELLDHPHIVTYQGKKYLYDGHHRWTLAMIEGKKRIYARNYIFG